MNKVAWENVFTGEKVRSFQAMVQGTRIIDINTAAESLGLGDSDHLLIGYETGGGVVFALNEDLEFESVFDRGDIITGDISAMYCWIWDNCFSQVETN